MKLYALIYFCGFMVGFGWFVTALRDRLTDPSSLWGIDNIGITGGFAFMLVFGIITLVFYLTDKPKGQP